MEGIITDIQRFSLKDGPGIRTTVFFQGCNMTCAWCHNPETISRKSALMLYKENCIQCGKCLKQCASGALSVNGTQVHVDRSLCVSCGACTQVCYARALVMSGRRMTIEDVMAEILQDEDYYRNSGGGVTLSGGEVFLQFDFAYDLLRRCKKKQIATAIESNLNVSWNQIEKLLPIVDLVMCDIKLLDSKRHNEWTGVGNKLILDNIRQLAQCQIPMIVRTPVIPGINQSEDDILTIARFINELKGNILCYELLNFNPLGDAKYKGLGMGNLFYEQNPAEDEVMEKLAKAATDVGNGEATFVRVI